MKERDKMPCTVYEIDRSLFAEDYNSEDIISFILKNVKDKSGYKFEEENISSNGFGEHSVWIFSCERTGPPKWRAFLSNALHKDSLLLKCKNTIHSFICFIEFKSHLFAITGGAGSFSIERFINQSFGLEILIRIFKRDSKVIKYIQDRGVSGIVIGQMKFYRGDRRFSEEAEFGKILKEVKAELGRKQVVEIFGLDGKAIKREVSGCLAKSSFKLSNAVSFDKLLVLVNKFSEILEKTPHFALNTVALISRRYPKNDTLIKELNGQLVKILYESFVNSNEVDFDFCHPQFEKYLTASSWKIPTGGDTEPLEFEDPVTWVSLIEKLTEAALIESGDEIDFKHSVLHRTINCSNEEDGNIISGTILEHIHGEITYNNKTYFRIDGEWYQVETEFIKELNAACKELVAEYCDDVLLKEVYRKGERENEFNSRFVGLTNMIVCDKITPDNIEVCDILSYDERYVYLIHVKKEFNNCMRDLAAQVSISANRIRQDRRVGYKFIDKLEEKIRQGHRSSDAYLKKLSKQSIPKNGLKELFQSKRDKEIVFCLAFVDTADDHRNLRTQTELFHSNIAKYAIIELKNQIKQMGFDFKIIQLKRNW